MVAIWVTIAYEKPAALVFAMSIMGVGLAGRWAAHNRERIAKWLLAEVPHPLTLAPELTESQMLRATTALPAPAGSQPGRFAVTFKSSLHRAGRWRVPEHLTTVVYKGDGVLDLRAAELTAHVTTISAVAYKSRIDILVPPGVRVETGGLGVSTGSTGPEGPLSPNAPVVHVRGYSYKGSVAVAGRPAER